ncbi:MAG: S8 family serine peptidase [Candidatus Bathyarchaeia archaeon]
MNAKREFAVICVLLLIIALIPLTIADMTARVSPKAPIALDWLSRTYGLPREQLTVANELSRTYSLLGKTVWTGKIMNTVTGKVYAVTLDERGSVVDLSAIREANKAAFAQRYGKLHPALYDYLQGAVSDEKLKIGIWLKSTETVAENRYVVSVSNKVQVAQSLTAMGYEVTYVSTTAPLVFVRLPAGSIQALQTLPDVDAIYLTETAVPHLDTAAVTEKAPAVWNAGINGTGVKVAVVEGDNIAFANPYLKDGVTKNPAVAVGSHATACAGFINSVHTTYRGIAWGSYNSSFGLLSAGSDDWSDAELIEATDWAIANGTEVINNSWGEVYDDPLMELIDRYSDYVVRNSATTLVNSAGNTGLGVGYVGSPGSAYNVITVGAFEDMNTGALWADDVMASYSSTEDPYPDTIPGSYWTDREKPEVVAVGGDVYSMYSTTTANPWTGTVGVGTSYAAPMVAGEAALLMNRRGSLMTWPETIKAITMATAWHNLEGQTRLSDYDGAGGVDIYRAYKTADESRYAGVSISSTPSTWNYSFNIPAANVGYKYRAVICWDSNPGADYLTDPLQADLDLYILNPSNSTIAYSISYDNNYEIVEFTPSVSGTYTAMVPKWRFDGASEWLGFAYDFMPPPARQRSYLSLDMTPTTAARGTPVTMSGQLSPMAATSIQLYYQLPGSTTWTLLTNIATTTTGTYSLTATVPASVPTGKYHLLTVWWGSATYEPAFSNVASLTVT